MTRTVIRITPLSQAILIKLLMEGTRTCRELAEESGLHYDTILQYTRALRHVGVLHICDWREDKWGAENTQIFKLGPGTDVKAYAMTGAERQRRYRNACKNRAIQAALTLRKETA